MGWVAGLAKVHPNGPISLLASWQTWETQTVGISVTPISSLLVGARYKRITIDIKYHWDQDLMGICSRRVAVTRIKVSSIDILHNKNNHEVTGRRTRPYSTHY